MTSKLVWATHCFHVRDPNLELFFNSSPQSKHHHEQPQTTSNTVELIGRYSNSLRISFVECLKHWRTQQGPETICGSPNGFSTAQLLCESRDHERGTTPWVPSNKRHSRTTIKEIWSRPGPGWKRSRIPL